MFSESKVTEIFFMADEFCKVYERMMSKSSLKTAEHHSSLFPASIIALTFRLKSLADASCSMFRCIR